MLKRIRYGEKISSPCALLLGGFDGIHAGHNTLVERAKAFGFPLAATSISGGKPRGDLFTFEEREYIYEGVGISYAIEIAFTEQFRNTTAEEFIRKLQDTIPVRAVVCGRDFRFGQNASGDPKLLKKLFSCPVVDMELLTEGGEKISSTRVKGALNGGDLAAANRLLKGGFFLQGRVEHGRRVGRTLGFPTLNLAYPENKFPIKEGVYGGLAETEAGSFPAVINFGARPTFGVLEAKTEAYLSGFDGDLYGTTVRIYPQKFYRPVVKFSSAEELKNQLRKDIGRLQDDQIRPERQ